MQEEGGQFNECGYVAYHGTMTLDILMGSPRGLPRGERRSSEVSEPCRLRQGEGYGACDDEMREDPAEQYQREQEQRGPQMGGMAQ